MNESVDKHIENLVDKAMRKSTLETPSFDFTSNVMTHVFDIKQSFATTYQPLISKQVWVMIALGFIAFVAYVVLITKPEASEWFKGFDIHVVDQEYISKILNVVEPSKTAAYSIGLLALMLLIQIPILKHYFDKRIIG